MKKGQDALKAWIQMIQNLQEKENAKISSGGRQDPRHVGVEVAEAPNILSLAPARDIVNVNHQLKMGAFMN